MELLRKINQQEKKTIVMVTHSAESATYGTDIIRLKDGQICMS
jgi:putative ABC transport system ATP-binding protein